MTESMAAEEEAGDAWSCALIALVSRDITGSHRDDKRGVGRRRQ
jgi:hypothetical protein